MATAHHADDQAETILMRLNRASGLSGLAGIRAQGVYRATDAGNSIDLLRPLLEWRRRDLARIVESEGIAAVQDPSNADKRFDRVRVRKAIAGADWLDPAALARSASNLADAEDVVDAYCDMVTAQNVRRDESDGIRAVTFAAGHPHLVELSVAERILREFGAAPRGLAVSAMIETLRRDGAATIGGVIVRRVAQASQGGDAPVEVWTFQREGPRTNS